MTELTHTTESGVLVISITGDLDVLSVSRAQAPLNDAVDGVADAPVLLDLSGVGYLGSMALTMIVAAARRASSRNAEVSLCGLQPRPLQVVRLTRLDRELTVYAGRDEAISDLGSNSDTPPSD